MGKTLYFDCFSGASGDMVLGALLDLGLPLDDLRGALGSLAVDLGQVSAERVLRAGVSATKFRVHEPGGHPHAGGGPRLTTHAHAHADGHVHTHSHHHHHDDESHGHRTRITTIR